VTFSQLSARPNQLLLLAGVTVAEFVQSKSPSAPSPQEKVVLSFFHDVLDGRRIELLEALGTADSFL
jgi:hypothetical protein